MNQQNKIDEWIDVFDISIYKIELEHIFKLIESNRCRLLYRSDIQDNSHCFYDEHCEIRISTKAAFKDKRHIIWCILHEFGHHKCGPIDHKDGNDLDVRIQHEKCAWEHARIIIKTMNWTESDVENFEEYKYECLSTYLKYKK